MTPRILDKLKPKLATPRIKGEKHIELTPENKKKLRKHMPARYKLMAEIIEEARNRRSESLKLLGMEERSSGGNRATCPKCGHRFEMKSPSKTRI